jgi:hypothetical protein
MTNLQLFPDQPPLTEKDIFDLEKRGFIIPEKFRNPHTGQHISNQNPGDICSFTLLCKVLKQQREFTKADAQRLIVIEAQRKFGRPRRSHLLRLFQTIEYCNRAEVENKIIKHRETCLLNHK